MCWEEKPFTVLGSCKATVRDPDRIFTGWPRQPFAEHPNYPWRFVTVVDTAGGRRWVLVSARSQPKPGAILRLACSPHTGSPLGYNSRDGLEVAAALSSIRGEV